MSSTAGAINKSLSVDALLTKRRLIVVVAHTALALLLALAAILLFRRLSGSFHQPLQAVAIILVAAALELLVCCIRCLYRTPVLHSSVISRARYWTLQGAPLRLTPIDIATTTAVLAIAISLSLPSTSRSGLLIAWLIIVSGEVIQRWRHCWRPVLNVPAKQPPMDRPTSFADATDEQTEPEIPPGLVQQITRIVEGGRESIHGLVQANIAANDRIAIAHIAFCPPLFEQPELSAHTLDCEDAEIHITQAESFGARFEVRLSSASDGPRSVLVEIIGSAKASLGS